MGYSDQKGAILITLLITITILATLGAAILHLNTVSVYSLLNAGNFDKAYYLAESGKRYAELRALPDQSYTVIRKEDGAFYRMVDESPTALPKEKISTEGFRISITDCTLESAGIVREGTPFEAVRKIATVFLNGSPCWHFDRSPEDEGYFNDSCGENNGVANEGGGEPGVWQSCDEGRSGVLQFDGKTTYADTRFSPFCEIGDGAPFTVAFWVKPAASTEGTVLGVSDRQGNRFAVGISLITSDDGQWTWAYGNKERQEAIPVVYDQWQHVAMVYDDDGNITLQVNSCVAPSQTAVYDYDDEGGSGIMPEPGSDNSLFVGAENVNGSASFYFSGSIDQIEIHNQIRDVRPDLFCPGKNAVAYYPFGKDADDHSGTDGSGNGHDAISQGPTPSQDRLGCDAGAYRFDGSGDYIYVPDDNELDLTTSGTIAAWIQILPGGGDAGIIHKGNLGSLADEAYGIEVSSAGRIRFVLRGADATPPMSVESEVPLIENTWHHIAATWDTTAGTSQMILYINGEESKTATVGFTAVANSDGQLNIGIRATEPLSGAFNGDIDEVLIYDRALSADEIKQLAL